METAYLVLLILLIVYVPLYLYVRKSEKAHEKGFVTYGPTIMIRTRWGLKLMDRLGVHKRFWNIMGAISLIVSFVLMAAIVTILIIDLSVLPSLIGKGGMGIEYALAIPGLNPMLPLVYGVIGLVISMVIHELAHGIQSRANDIEVKSSGILYGVVPLGAFVEPDEEGASKASRKARLHLYAAGITTNTIAAIILFVLMISCLGGCLTCDYSDDAATYSVVSGTEAYDLGIPTSSILSSVDGMELDFDGLIAFLESEATGKTIPEYTVEFIHEDETMTKAMHLGACVGSITPDSPADRLDMTIGSYISAFATCVDGGIGTYTYIRSPDQFSDFMSSTSPGETVYVTYMKRTVDPVLGITYVLHEDEVVALDSNGSKGFFGIAATISGITFTTPDTIMEMGTNPFLGREGVADHAMGALAFISNSFKGFSPIPESVTWWFDCTVMDDDIFWIIIWIIYWTFWLNIVLGISNALPAIPFDGGLLFMGGVDWVMEKMGVRDEKAREERVGRICSAVSYMMIFVMILVVVVIAF